MYSNAKTACTVNESMRQNHLQIKAAHHLSNHQEHNTLNFPALWGLELYLVRHIVLQVFDTFFLRIVLNLLFRSAGPSAGSQLIVNSLRWRQLKEYINYQLFLMYLHLAMTLLHHHEDLLSLCTA